MVGVVLPLTRGMRPWGVLGEKDLGRGLSGDGLILLGLGRDQRPQRRVGGKDAVVAMAARMAFTRSPLPWAWEWALPVSVGNEKAGAGPHTEATGTISEFPGILSPSYCFPTIK